jgi:Ca-activated chloride channel family protein
VTLLPLTAQQAAQDSNGVPVIRVETRLVNVPINVVDAHGVAVADLSQDDFTVKEDGRTQKIALFERESSTPLSIVMAVDTSGSVFSQFKTEREAAKRFAEDILRPEDEMDLIAFSYQADEIVPYTSDPRRIDDGLKRLVKGDDTALYDAVYVASERLTEARADATRRRILVLVTDGGDNSSKREIGYTKAIAEAQRAGAAIYPIIIVPIMADAGRNTGGEHALIQMAADTGGKYFYVTDRDDLKTAFAHLSDDLRTQYLLGYYAPKRGVDSGFRRIDVTLKDSVKAATMSLRARTGYYADAR